jgi:hypothetical protein
VVEEQPPTAGAWALLDALEPRAPEQVDGGPRDRAEQGGLGRGRREVQGVAPTGCGREGRRRDRPAREVLEAVEIGRGGRLAARDGKSLRPTIARIWRGRTPAARADEYARYLYEHGIKPLEEKALGVQLLREDRAGESEFVTISYWESVEAMARFAGADPRRIHHLERDAEFLIELPSGVQVLDMVASSGRTGGDAP